MDKTVGCDWSISKFVSCKIGACVEWVLFQQSSIGIFDSTYFIQHKSLNISGVSYTSCEIVLKNSLKDSLTDNDSLPKLICVYLVKG